MAARPANVRIPPGPLSSKTARMLESATRFLTKALPRTSLNRSIPMTEGGTYRGNHLSAAVLNFPFRAQITSTADPFGFYAWKEVIATPSGWQVQNGLAIGSNSGNLVTLGVNGAFEANGINTPPSTIVEMQRAYWDANRGWVFAFEYCCGGGSASGSAGCTSGSGSSSLGSLPLSGSGTGGQGSVSVSVESGSTLTGCCPGVYLPNTLFFSPTFIGGSSHCICAFNFPAKIPLYNVGGGGSNTWLSPCYFCTNAGINPFVPCTGECFLKLQLVCGQNGWSMSSLNGIGGGPSTGVNNPFTCDPLRLSFTNVLLDGATPSFDNNCGVNPSQAVSCCNLNGLDATFISGVVTT